MTKFTRMRFTKMRLLVAFAAIVLLVIFVIWFLGRDTSGQAEAAPLPPEVLAAAVVTRDYAPRSTYTGTLAAVETVELKPRVSGRILEVSVPEGRIVRQGQRLFKIDPAPFQARLAAAKAATQEVRARLGLAQVESERARRLVEEGVVAQQRADEADAALAERTAQLASARANERVAQLDLAYTSIEAPITGRVGKILVTRGNMVGSGETATPLTTIVSVDSLYVEFNVDEATYLAALVQAQEQGSSERPPVQVRLEDGSVRSARLDFIGNTLDEGTGTIPVRAILSNRDGRLAPGLFAEVEIAIGAVRPTVLISDLAVGVEQGRRYVLVVDRQNETQYRPVQLGGLVGDLRVVEDGLAAGERILVKGLAGPGMKVRPRMISMSARTPAKDDNAGRAAQ